MRYIIGVDEVGRGPLAGPVTVCAAVFPGTFSFDKAAKVTDVPLKDSKQLSETRRKIWARYLKSRKIAYALASIPPQRIDRINIRNATNEAVEKAITKLLLRKRFSPADTYICMDGGLAVSDARIIKLGLKHKPRSIVRGDAIVPAIAAASILAKVARDRYMERMAKRYPRYGFEKHKGYGTPEHYRALRRYGPVAAHRRSFLKTARMRYDT